jgi:hypothetical protein
MPRKLIRPIPGFDVVCTIGHVEFGDGPHTPTEAAMLLIAQHDAEGSYSFPHPNGGTYRITVEHLTDDAYDGIIHE